MDDFLNNLWNRRAEEETGNDTEGINELATPEMEREHFEKTKEVKIYKEIEKQITYDKTSQELFVELREAIIRYYQTIVALEKMTVMSDGKDTVGEADLARRRAHEVVMSNLNALSRYIGKQGLDNEWRRVIGLERKQVTDWVKNVAPYILTER